jgi:hypothetical protein
MCSLWELHGQAIASTHPEAAEKKRYCFYSCSPNWHITKSEPVERNCALIAENTTSAHLGYKCLPTEA